MVKLIINPDIKRKIIKACAKADIRECGGVLFGEHVGENLFRIAEVSTNTKTGIFAHFIRDIVSTIKQLRRFFSKYKHKYTKYNYMGEWHSHPQFALKPSNKDEESIMDIVGDDHVGANFIILMIVRLEPSDLKCRAWTYYANGVKEPCNIEF